MINDTFGFKKTKSFRPKCPLCAEADVWQLSVFMTDKENSSVIRQKGESQNGCFKKPKHAKISEKHTFLTHVRVRISG